MAPNILLAYAHEFTGMERVEENIILKTYQNVRTAIYYAARERLGSGL